MRPASQRLYFGVRQLEHCIEFNLGVGVANCFLRRQSVSITCIGEFRLQLQNFELASEYLTLARYCPLPWPEVRCCGRRGLRHPGEGLRVLPSCPKGHMRRLGRSQLISP
jgi:hypothetical protein